MFERNLESPKPSYECICLIDHFGIFVFILFEK
jgi:hypothetical protein